MKRLCCVSLAVISLALKGAQEAESAPQSEQQLPEQHNDVVRELGVNLVPPECAPKDLNTVDVQAGGNWVVKRAFWEAAVSAYDAIVQLNDQLYGLQMTYINQRNDAGKAIDTKFIELGFDRGELLQVVNSIVQELEQEREIRGDLSLEEREQVARAKQQLKLIQQLQADLEAIEKLNLALDEVQVQVIRTINQCRELEKRAWENYKLIGLELNDKRARDLFYQMEGFFQSIQKNIAYLNNELKSYFTESIERVQKLLDDVTQESETIKDAGVDLQAQYEKLFKQDIAQLEEREAAEHKLDQEEMERLLEQKKKLEEQIAKDRAAQNSWSGRFAAALAAIIGAVRQFFVSIWHAIAFWSKK